MMKKNINQEEDSIVYRSLIEKYKSNEPRQLNILKEYVVNGDMPKAYGPSLADQIKAQNNEIRKQYILRKHK